MKSEEKNMLWGGWGKFHGKMWFFQHIWKNQCDLEKEKEAFPSVGNNVNRSIKGGMVKNKRVVWVSCGLQQGNEWEISLDRFSDTLKVFLTRKNAVIERQIVDQYLIVYMVLN